MQPKNALSPEEFGTRLRWFRNQRNLTQADLGKSVSRTATSISEWEKGESEPTLEQIIGMAKILGVTPERLAFGVEASPASARVEEEQEIYGAHPKDEIASEFAAILASAGDDRGKLGWIQWQMRTHLTPPAHWRPAQDRSEEIERALAALRATRPVLPEEASDRGQAAS